jgi:hypothetical protein
VRKKKADIQAAAREIAQRLRWDSRVQLGFELLILIEKFGVDAVWAEASRLCQKGRGHPDEDDKERLRRMYLLLGSETAAGPKLTVSTAAELVAADNWTHSPTATAQRLRRKFKTMKEGEPLAMVLAGKWRRAGLV